ncbi:14768_t:CDS:2, partial [Gigaspora margarita]
MPALHSAISNETSSSASVLFIFLSSTIESEKPYYNTTAQKNSLNKQKCAEDQLSRIQVKKHEALENKGEVIIYNSPGHLSFFLLNSNLSEQIYSCIEFGKAAKKSQKEIIKVHTISHLRREMEKKYQLVKNAKQFASAFATHSVIILQDDKAKILLEILAVGRTFKTVQSANEP